VFAKEPRPGFVKTRMTPPLSPDLAAALYAALLDDVLEATAEAAPALGLEPVLAVHPPAAVAALAGRAPAAFRVIAQRGSDLGARMSHAVAEAAAGAFDPILIRGSDSPALTAATLREAVDRLARADLVVCPDADGGYNLVGLHHPVSGLFSHMMSVSSALDEMLQRATDRGLRVDRLEPGFDLDTAQDLAWLATARLRGDSLPCPRTLAFLDENALWRHVRREG
jgi:rSAM/selenodomain-associated transferase 1